MADLVAPGARLRRSVCRGRSLFREEIVGHHWFDRDADVSDPISSQDNRRKAHTAFVGPQVH